MSSQLVLAINQIRAGNSAEGKRLLKEVLQSEPKNEEAWFWLAGLAENDHDREACLKRVLLINPKNKSARRRMAELKLPAHPQPAADGRTTGGSSSPPEMSVGGSISTLQPPAPSISTDQARVAVTKIIDKLESSPPPPAEKTDTAPEPKQTASHSGYYDLFISYSRRDKPFVQNLYETLLDQGREVWVDWGNIPLTADWRNEIKEGIERANAVVFVISPDFLVSEECIKELQLAQQLNKRLIPLVYRDVPPAQVPDSLASLNWIFARPTDSATDAMAALQTTLDTDLEWVKSHTRLLVKANEWQANQGNRSFLLRGDDLNRAEMQIAQAEKNPAPTLLQKQYVLTSRQSATSRQRALLLRVSVMLVISIAMAVLAFIQYRRANGAQLEADEKRAKAQQEAQIALSRLLGSQAIIRADDDPALAALLSLKAETLDIREDSVFASELLSSLEHSPFLVTVLHGHTANVRSVSFNPDGTLLASGGKDKSIILWDTATWKAVAEPMAGHTDRVTQVTFSPDGQTIASSGRDGNIIFWDVASRQIIGQPIAAHTGWANSVAYLPDGQTLVSAGDDGKIIFWDVASRQPRHTLQAHSEPVLRVVVNPSGALLAAGSSDNTISLWDTTSLQAIGTPLTGHTGKINDLAFSPDGSILVSASADHTLQLWDGQNGKALAPPLTGHLTSVTAVTFNPSGTRIISGSEDDSIISWDTRTQRQLGWPLVGHANSVLDLAFSPNGKYLASASSDTKIVLWDFTAGQTMVDHQDVVRSVAFSPNGHSIASGGDDTVARQWDIGNTNTSQPYSSPSSSISSSAANHSRIIWSVAFSPNGDQLASGNEDGSIVIWDNSSLAPAMPPLAQHNGGVLAVTFSPNGQWLASAGQDQQIIMWDAATGQPITRWNAHTDDINSLVFSPDSRLLVSGSSDDTAQLWDAASGQPVGSPLQGHSDDVNSVALSLDGQTIATGSSDTLIILWDAATGQETGRLYGHINRVTSVAFSPNGQTLASGSYDKNIILWDLSTGLPIGPPLRDHTNDVNSVAWSPDGEYLVSGSWDTTLTLWKVNLTPWSERACQIANRNLTQTEWDVFIGSSFEFHELCPGK